MGVMELVKGKKDSKALDDARVDAKVYEAVLAEELRTRNGAPAEARARQAECESKRGVLLTAVASDRKNVEAARAELYRSKALRRAGGASDADVKAAQAELDKAEEALEASEGGLIICDRELGAGAVRMPVLVRQALEECREKLWAEARREVPLLAASLTEARRINARLKAVLVAAETTFAWASAEARAFGHKGGLPDWLWIEALADDPHAGGGTLEHWAVEMVRAGLLDPALDAQLRSGELEAK